ncbi:MAG TPA: hypothetical protein VER04_13470 [Polyangiaceae bacterium]|nr:hypothetical protein [Polyangiaceae bacterium]
MSSELQQVEIVEEVPLDFSEFLGKRLGVETGTALSLLGAFLVTFEPVTARGGARPLQSPAAFNS